MLVDVAIDQGGCFETSQPTTHDDPVFVVDGVIHYCVANMPGARAVTSTKALTNATLPYVEAIAEQGLASAVARDPALAKGVNVVGGKITYEAVAEAHGLDVHPARDALLAVLGVALLRSARGSGCRRDFTTSHVTPGREGDDADDEDGEADAVRVRVATV